MAIVLNKKNFNSFISSNMYVFVDFYAPWCGHCIHLEPTWTKLAQRSKNIVIAKYNATDSLPSGINISGYPTLLLFKNGKQIQQYQGSRELEDLEKFVKTMYTQNGGSKQNKGKVTLIKITKSSKPEKKLMAIFSQNNKEKIVHFGASGYSDYTIHKDSERKKRYIARHKQNEIWDDPTSAGALSRYILWNKPSLKDSIISYKKRFKFE